MLWLIHADYPLPPSEEKTEILRVVVRESLSLDMIDRLVTDIGHVMEQLMVSTVVDLVPRLHTDVSAVHRRNGSRSLAAVEPQRGEVARIPWTPGP